MNSSIMIHLSDIENYPVNVENMKNSTEEKYVIVSVKGLTIFFWEKQFEKFQKQIIDFKQE